MVSDSYSLSDYEAFLNDRRHFGRDSGFSVSDEDLNDRLFDFQKAIVSWACRRGRAAIFADCGLGKTPMQLEWANQVVRKTGGRVLILTPLAVGPQTISEAEKFGIEAARSNDGRLVSQITVTNYERLSRFSPQDFVGVVCDESSILKNFDGKTKAAVTEFMRRIPYRLLCTATASPNDYIELGTSSEALGELGHMDMLGMFFRNQQGNSTATKGMYRGFHAPRQWESSQWRFKRHAEQAFWRWVCSWARALRRPSDIGYSDDGFVLPPLIERETVISCSRPLDGKLFQEVAIGLHEQRQERRATISERCEAVAEKVAHDRYAIAWCHLNDEGDLLERLIPDSVQVKGSQSDDEKEAKLTAFSRGDVRVLITKPRIGGFGLNWQHCSHVTFFPSHSYEQYYQGVRRCWRFGQQNSVVVDVITTEGELDVLKNLQRKAKAADRMFTELAKYANDALRHERDDRFTEPEKVPSWM